MDERDPPIEPQNFSGGVTVVEIGDIRVSRGLSRRPYSSCKHEKVVYDQQERRVWCQDCETNIDPFDMLMALIEPYNAAVKKLKQREERVLQQEAFTMRRRATQELDKAWRRRNVLPACPSCHAPLLPEDFENGVKCMVKK